MFPYQAQRNNLKNAKKKLKEISEIQDDILKWTETKIPAQLMYFLFFQWFDCQLDSFGSYCPTRPCIRANQDANSDQMRPVFFSDGFLYFEELSSCFASWILSSAEMP